MARIKVEETIEKKVNALKEEEVKKEAELKEIRHELKRFQHALDSLRGNLKEKRKKILEPKINQAG